VKEDRNVRHTIKSRKANWIVHTLRRKCLLKRVIEGKMEERIKVMGRRERSSYWMTLRKREDNGN
jgi:hypothetical protein